MVENSKSRKSRGSVEARPVLETLREPEYPLFAEVGSSKTFWGKATTGAATFFLAINIGGVVESRTAEQAPSPPRVVQAKETPATNTQHQNRTGLVVAPLFEHGEGRGSTGCVVTTPPVFLSEEEALQVIKEELAKHGVKLGVRLKLMDVVISMPVTGGYSFSKEKNPHKKFTDPEPLEVDAMDQEKKIAITFVSKNDFDKTRAKDRPMLSVSSYDPRKVAKHISEVAVGKGKETRYLGVFYDPMAQLDFSVVKLSDVESDMTTKKEKGEKKKELSWEERKELAQKESKQQLRQQVKDFADWLKKRGVKKDG